MLNRAIRNTNKLVREVAAKENLRIGRFFTKKAEAHHMASLFALPAKDGLSLLDAGAGTGILSAAAVEGLGRRAKEEGRILRIHLTCYENDAMMLPMLYNNLERVRKRARTLYGVRLSVTVKEEDFLSANHEEAFDLAVLNPPSLLVQPEKSLGDLEKLCQGETDLAYLFACKVFSLLAPEGECVMLLPTELSSGVYLEHIRRYLLSGALTHIILPDNGERSALLSGKAAAAAAPFAKHMALRLQKEAVQQKITVVTVNAKGEAASTAYEPSFLIRDEDKKLLLLHSREEEETVRFVEAQKETLSSLGLKMKTGLALASRHASLLRGERTNDAVPLLRPCGLADGRIRHPIGDGRDYIVPRIPSLRQPNKNLLLLKRVPTKKDGRMIVAAVYYASQLAPFTHISTDNKLNFIDYADSREMSMPLLLGLYALFSSSLYDRYLKITGGVRRVNASLYDTLPLPKEKMILEIGRSITVLRVFNHRTIDATVTAAFRKYSASFR